ncbi:hypothetical protein [Amycolatopsis sp. GA6-003]|uniref:hypothetical protein n=1 Tax=Amycolatopsis sp. GA6-003 TaxID=2652444 RepID=UPI003916CE97
MFTVSRLQQLVTADLAGLRAGTLAPGDAADRIEATVASFAEQREAATARLMAEVSANAEGMMSADRGFRRRQLQRVRNRLRAEQRLLLHRELLAVVRNRRQRGHLRAGHVDRPRQARVREMSNDGGVVITLDKIYDQVIATKEIAAKLVDKVDAVEKRDSDHEARIRALERKVWMALGGGAAGTIAAAILGG